MAKLHDISMFIDVFKERCKKFNISLEECARRYGYARELKLYKRGILVRDGVFVNLDGTPIVPGKVGPNAAKSGSTAPRPVLQYTLEGKLVKEWPSATDAEREGGFCRGNICDCCCGKRKSHRGFVWKYKETVIFISGYSSSDGTILHTC